MFNSEKGANQRKGLKNRAEEWEESEEDAGEKMRSGVRLGLWRPEKQAENNRSKDKEKQA